MPINESYNENVVVEAIAAALDNFYTNLIKKVDSLNVKAVMKRKNPYLFRAKVMNHRKKRSLAMYFLNRLQLPPHKDRRRWQRVWISWWNGIIPSTLLL